MLLNQKLLISVNNLMKYMSKFAIIFLVIFVLGLYSCSDSQSATPTYETPVITKTDSVKFN